MNLQEILEMIETLRQEQGDQVLEWPLTSNGYASLSLDIFVGDYLGHQSIVVHTQEK